MPQRFSEMVEAIRSAAFDLIHFWEVGSDAVNYFLPRFRLAPLQTTSLGVQVTSGLREVDYYLSSELIEPPEGEAHYTERLLRLPGLLTHQDRQRIAGRAYDRRHFGLPDDQTLYFCAQQLRKFHPDFDAMLLGILRQDPRGRVVLLEERSPFISHEMKQRLARSLGDMFDRVTFVPRQALDGYFSLIALCDVMLDTLHFGGATTAYDAFSFNKPVVTMPGRFQRSRFTLACYRLMGLDQCVAESPVEYIETAVTLGTNRDLRQQTQMELEARSELLFNDRRSASVLQDTWLRLINCSR